MIQAEPGVALALDHMGMADIEEVCRIERRSFSNPWPMSAYRRELRRPEQNSYFVLRVHPGETPANGESRSSRTRFLESIMPARRLEPHLDGPHLAGYVGMWQMYDETHVTTIAVDLPYRGLGYGELLLVTAFAEAIARGSAWLSLEVRVSNKPAQALYEKYGMTVYGRRAAYYTDNHEDALVMWSRSLRDPDYRGKIEDLRETLIQRLPEIDVPEFVSPQPDVSPENRGGPPHG
jgi:ribosomal-protein-alanine N-acetyltransferase